ncbi:MAG TPA: mannose-1-phosphate guanylyltransferase [Candidatus Coprenecus pullistercoris]|nr:mannose-1-phosphate guanylyltransferase [Candidatus Coprenecus pullistercoris]
MDKNYYCVIMAGGIGSRFWPVSRNAMPKQFLDILGIGKSFLQLTYDRFARIVPAENIIVVTSQSYVDLVRRQLPQLAAENILAEPYRRNTAPCIAYASTKIRAVNPAATMVVAPSDHFISNEALFVDTISAAMKYASEKDELFTLGIDPTRPETGYGYIQCNMKQSKTIDGNIAYKVKTFTEKPNRELAKVFVESGEFLWNSGIFVWNVSAICSALAKWLPEVFTLFNDGDRYYGTPQEQDFITRIYEECPAISIDYGVMEKTSRAWVFQASFGWSDLGTWESLYLHAAKDSDRNLVKCTDTMIDSTSGCVVISQEKDKLVVVKGMKDYLIVNTDDVLMICPRDDSKFKEILADLAVNEKSRFM